MKKILYNLCLLIVVVFTACEDENLPKASLDMYEASLIEATPGDEEVTLRWDAIANANPTGYYLSWTASSSTVQGGEINIEGNSTFTTIKELVNGETYTFSIQPIYGDKGRGGVIQVKARPISSRPAPTNFVAIAGDKSINLQWKKPASDALTGYTLTISSGSQEITIAKELEEYEVTNLNNDTEYTFTLKAVYPNGLSDAVRVSATPSEVPLTYLWSEISLTSNGFTGYVKTSNPVFSPDGKIMYIPTSSPNGHLFAIDVVTGVIKWVFEISELTYGGGALVGPDGTIYQGSDAAIYAIKPDGSQKWKITTSGSGALARVRAFPAMSADGTLYCLSNSKLYAVNTASGSEVWSKTLPNSAGIGSAVLVDRDGIVYAGTDKGIFAFNPIDGSTKWSNTNALLNVTESGSMAIAGNTIYAALKGTAGIAAINSSDGSLKWNAGAAGDAYFPIVDKNGVIYFTEKNASGSVYAINSDGTQKWVKNIGGSLNYGGLALDENGIIYGGTQSQVDGNYKVYAINTVNGEFVFNNANEQQIMAAFSIGPDKRMYFGTIGSGNIGKIQAYEINADLESASWSVRGGDLQGTNRQK
ncbi:MAG: PQQ-binding-like beta-propeller repeat protein [Prevotella sp.]|jgi:outer membrane protein assembly factor BamB|nr:PQQ-binding-like beta-propeller repeat protein [Prevotella sp.]